MSKIKLIIPELIPVVDNVEIFGVKVEVVHHIDVEQKEAMANEIIANSYVFNEEQGKCYEARDRYTMYDYLVLKYYTNIDLTDYQTMPEIKRLIDAMNTTGDMGAVKECAKEDLRYVDVMYTTMFWSMQKIFETENSLQQKVKTMFENELDLDKLAQAVAQTQNVNEGMIDLMGAARKQKEAPNQKAGAGILNFAKRTD